MQARQNQFPQQSMDGVSKRNVSRRAVPEEGDATPAPRIPRITSQGLTCVPGSLAQQLTLQDPGNWKEAQKQLLRYQLAGHNQLLLLCPDLRQERQQGQESSQRNKGSNSMGLSPEKGSSVPSEAVYLHTAPPEVIQQQLWAWNSVGVCMRRENVQNYFYMVNGGEAAWSGRTTKGEYGLSLFWL